MIITPLWEVKQGVYCARFKVNKSYVYATATEHNLIEGERYLVVGTEGLYVAVVNETGETELYSDEWFSMTKPE